VAAHTPSATLFASAFRSDSKFKDRQETGKKRLSTILVIDRNGIAIRRAARLRVDHVTRSDLTAQVGATSG
jgi:hypothetical protein